MTDEAAAQLGQDIITALSGIEGLESAMADFTAAMGDFNTAITLLVSVLLVIGIFAFAVIRRDVTAYIIGGIALISVAFQMLPIYVAAPMAAMGLYLMLRASIIQYRAKGGE